MAIRNIPELARLKGLNEISEAERQAFNLTNAEKLKGFKRPQVRRQAAEILFNNQKFIDHFGQDAFDKMNDGTENAYNLRNSLLKSDIASKAFSARFSPWNEDGTMRDNHRGLGADYEKYFGYIDKSTGRRVGGLSDDGLLKVVESGYMSPDEFEEDWKKRRDSVTGRRVDSRGNVYFDPCIIGGTAPSTNGLVNDALTGESARQKAKERNDRILEHIYNDEADNSAVQLGDIVSQVYAKADPKIVGGSDEETVALFKKAITPDYANGNMGIPEYASHYGIVEGEGISEEMKDFTVDNMREVLAKKAVYDQYMSPEMAKTALDNEAKRYIHDHQGFGKKAAMFGKDVLIAASSYTADKVNGFYNLGLMAVDAIGDKPVVWVDDTGNVIDPNKVAVRNGGSVGYYMDENMKEHSAHRMEIDRTTLHNMGKNLDGSEDTSWLNPQDWTRREAMGVWDKDLAKQYEQIGSSPYKVAYNPNDDRDLLYESFKMMSFGLADAGSQLIPFGIGAAGKALSTANHVGRIVRNLGSATNAASRFILQNPIGQSMQGITGAVGIAEAYQRGAFNETLAQNMANLEQAVQDRSRNEIYNQYQSDAGYRKQVDALIDARAASMKADYIAQMGAEGKGRIVDEKALDEMLRARAQDAVLADMVSRKVSEHKNSDDYVRMQEEAINSAGLAATNSFWPEAVKYALVNTMGHRRFLYSNPTSVAQRAAQNFRGLREVTTSAGRRRLATDVGQTLTNADKWKKLGKFAGKQAWGGAWTNGTDDMMVDAAERINEDSFGRYLNQYENGEALADTYGFADGLFSYWTGLQNSMGQQTTAEAALVGLGGSVVSGNIHFANIASLATKEGREAYRQNFQQQYERDADGMLKRDENGKPIVRQLGWKDNWRDRLGFFIQNGVLNEYYGTKQAQRDLQSHADYVNELLDQYEDFDVIKNLVASDMGTDNAINIGDKKTMRFVQAFNAINALEHLGNSEKDPATMSSIVQERKNLIERASKLGTEGGHDFTDEELQSLVGQYYSNNAIPQSAQNTKMALEHIGQNARKLQEAYNAYNKAEREIQSLERDKGAPIIPAVRFQMKLSQALDSHWRDRVQTMKDEIGDSSTGTEAPTGEELIATFGGKKKADSQLKYYETQKLVLTRQAADATNEVQKKLEAYNKAQEAARNAESSDAILQAQKDLKDARDAYEEAVENKMYQEDMISALEEKKLRLSDALDAWEKGTRSRVLSADEIMALDPVTRARMMLPENRQFYSTRQQKQIEKLEKRLKMEHPDGDPLQKIQDIALLTQRIAQNEDAYNRISRNPDAAAIQLEKQKREEAEKAVALINEENAWQLGNYILSMTDALRGRMNVRQQDVDDYVYKTLRVYNPTLLDIIDGQNILYSYPQQVVDAKAWAEVLSDLGAVIDNAAESDAWKDGVRNAIDAVLENTNSRDEIINTLDIAIEKGHPQADALTKVLLGLDQQKYQKEAVIIESRRRRNETLAAQRQQQEEARKKAEEAAKAAAENASGKPAAQPVRQGAEDGTMALSTEEQNRLVAESEDISVNLDFGETPEGKPENAAAPITPAPSEQKPLDILLDWVNGKIDTKEVQQKLLGTEYVREVKGSAVLHTVNHVSFTNAVDRDLGKYIQDKYPFLTVEGVKVATGVSTFGGDAGLLVVKDAEGNEYGTPSNFLRSLASKPDGRAAEVVRKGLEVMQQNQDSSVNNNMKSGHDDTIGDYVHGQSPTLADEAQEAGDGTVAGNDAIDPEALNNSMEKSGESHPNLLSGNAMAEYEKSALMEHRLVHKKGEKPDDNMNKYYAWMDAAGIRLQNIIDDELPHILARNPHTKIKFACVRPERNATNDYDMITHLLLVTDYDDNAKAAHKDSNGGVIESEGRKYLIVGVAGYGNSKDRRDLYDVIYGGGFKNGMLQQGKVQYFKDHPSERFRVLQEVSTEIVPGEMTPGWIIRQNETDEAPQSRKISELLADKERNPHGLTMEKLSWSIIEYTQNLDIIKGSPKEVMHPQNQNTNAGRVFVLIPAGNGKLLAAKIDALYYNDSKFNKESSLYQEIQNSLMQLLAPQYKDRYDALLDLLQKFYLTPEGHGILLSREPDGTANGITFVRNGQKVHTVFTKAPDFTTQDFLDAVADWNPRINITGRVLRSPKLLQQYDEAGALMTDLAKLGTAGVNYSVYGVDAEGRMVKPANVDWVPDRADGDSEYRDSHRLDVPYMHGVYYQYDIDSGKYTLNGVEVTDRDTIKGLDYARRIIGLSPARTERAWDYYVLGSGENAEVIRQSSNTKKIEEVTGEEAQEIVREVEERLAAAAREAAMLAALSDDAESGQGEGDIFIDRETGNLDIVDSQQPSESRPDTTHSASQSSPQPSSSAPTKNFTQTMRGINRSKITEALKQKWPDAPYNSLRQLESFLREKGLQLDIIPTEEVALNAWIHNNITCK